MSEFNFSLERVFAPDNYNEINVVECNNNKPDGDIRITTYDTEEEWVIKVKDYYPYMVEDKIRYKEQ